MFKAVDSRVSFPELEERILAFWKTHDVFRRSVEERPAEKLFTFYEGPPTANGRPGIHHVLSRVFKDLIPRYKTMQGYRVPRKAGWDTHGLPVELEVEKRLGLKSKQAIEEFGIAQFNAECKASVSLYVDEWTRLSERIAFWADFDHPYVTWHNDYIETCWWIFKQMWEHGGVYQDYRVTPHCPRCGTSLSDHEVAQGYEDDTADPSVYVKFGVVQDEWARLGHPQVAKESGEVISLVAWTTTPWTLPGNVAVAVKADADYGVYELATGEQVVVATALAETVLGLAAVPRLVIRGSRLLGLQYEPLYRPETLDLSNMKRFERGIPVDTNFDYIPLQEDAAEAKAIDTMMARLTPLRPGDEIPPRRVVPAQFVSLDDGTGIVHIAPAFGAEDFELGRRELLLFAQPVDLRGVMAEGLPGAGKFVKDADKDVVRDLTERGLLLKSGTIKHTYPFCWRCHTPLLYYAKPSWYINTRSKKKSLLEGNQQINWYPEHLKNGRFGNWLENNVDWAFSRERYWGTPLPFWVCEDTEDADGATRPGCGQVTCVGSVSDLRKWAVDAEKAASLTDLHRPYIDEILIHCQQPWPELVESKDGTEEEVSCRGIARRVPEVADAWFDSGAMPYAQWHYPFENVAEFERSFPADYICEAIDQTRGWFYTLHAEATMLKAAEAVPEGISFRNVICLGHILDEQGRKMSKHIGNVVAPWEVIDLHGADATRWYMYAASPAGSPRRFSARLVEEGLRQFLLTLWNTYSFFVSYANIDEADPRTPPTGAVPEIDRWLLSELNALILKVTAELEAYDPTDAARAIQEFVDDLSNWYVRRSRRRFWRGVSESDSDKQSAYHTLWTALVTLSKLLAPFTPFIAEELWQNLVRSIDAEAPESVHLAGWATLVPLDPKQHPFSLNPLTYVYSDPDTGETHDPTPHFTDPALMERMQAVKRVCSLGRAARSKAGLKVRQPVQSVLFKAPATSVTRLVLNHHREMILEELNAKEIVGIGSPSSNAQSHLPFVDVAVVGEVVVKPNLPVLGPKFGAKLGAIRAALAKLPGHEVEDALRRNGSVELAEAGVTLERDDLLQPEFVAKAGYAAASESGYTVAITTTLTPELEDEGLARELVRRIQDMRREAGFALADRITVWYSGGVDLARVMGSHGGYIRAETLSTELVEGAPPADAFTAEHDLEGVTATLAVRRNR